MISTSVLKACLASLFCYYLASAPVDAVPTLQSAREPAALQVRDNQAPNAGAINEGSLAYTRSTLTLNVFTELDCKGDQLGETLLYSQDVGFGKDSNWDNVESFKSIQMSRPLEEQEQLDLSHLGQDGGQTQAWSCGGYMMNYRVGTAAGCHNNPNGEGAGCIRLWHY